MPRKPFFPAVNSAAITAPSAIQARLLASCLMLIVSTIRLIRDLVDTRNLTLTDSVDRQVGRALGVL